MVYDEENIALKIIILKNGGTQEDDFVEEDGISLIVLDRE